MESDTYGTRWRVDVLVVRQARNVVVRTLWIIKRGDERSAVCDLLGDVMPEDKSNTAERLAVLNVVALLADRPGNKLARGQVGTVVESLDQNTVLVEFSDEQGRAYAVVPAQRSELLLLHYVPQAA